MTTPSETTPTEVPYRPHVGPSRQYMRDIILGVNDGLVSVFLLITGVVGGGLGSREVLLAGLAASAAGAISMAAGEYIATKSQEEVFESERELEIEHLEFHRDVELDEIREMFGDMGLGTEDVERIVEALDRDDDAFLKVMMALEFGVVEEERRSPYTAAALSGVLFLAGSLPSVLPFFFVDSTGMALLIAAIGSGIALFGVGVAKTFVTRKNWVWSGTENVLIGTAGALISFGVGSIYNAVA
ncbi:MAG: VIT1/CCC1 transporter family protein [Acidimicrobiia bacterium]